MTKEKQVKKDKTIQKDIKENKCGSCGKFFSTAQSLNRHIYTVHEGHKDHKCESCNKSFSEAGDLNKHIRNVHEDH